jgi:ubiquinone/menaquinone biosynthesis C-methylase UbiE
MNANEIARAFYDLIVPLYDPFYGARTPVVRDMRRRIVERLELREGFSVLEVAVGTGANLSYVKERIGPRGKIFGIDISEGMLEKCKRNMREEGIEADLVLGNAENLPYKDGSFDAVLHFGAINFIHDKKKAVEEAVRVAKPGAKIVFGDEYFPFFGTFRSVANLLPENVTDVNHTIEWCLIPFWILDLRKKG